MGTRKPNGYWDLPRAREGGVGAFFLSLYIPEEYYPGRFETKQALRRIDHALQQLELNRDTVELALNADDVEKMDRRCAIHKNGQIKNYDERCVSDYLTVALKAQQRQMAQPQRAVRRGVRH